jgi:hypothetical protein
VFLSPLQKRRGLYRNSPSPRVDGSHVRRASPGHSAPARPSSAYFSLSPPCRCCQ